MLLFWVQPWFHQITTHFQRAKILAGLGIKGFVLQSLKHMENRLLHIVHSSTCQKFQQFLQCCCKCPGSLPKQFPPSPFISFGGKSSSLQCHCFPTFSPFFWWIHCAPCYIQSCESTLLLINWCLSTIRLLWCWVIVRIVLLAEHTWLIHCNCLFNCWQVFTQEDWMLWLNQSVLEQSISLGVYTPMQPAYCTFSLPLYFLIHFCPNRPFFF